MGGHRFYTQPRSLIVNPSPQGLGMGCLGQGRTGAPPYRSQDRGASGHRFEKWAVDQIFPNKGNR